MEIEPLKSLLQLYKNKDKIFQQFLDKETISKLNGYYSTMKIKRNYI